MFIALLFCTTVHAQVAPTEGWGHPPPDHHHHHPRQKQEQYQRQKQYQEQEQKQQQKTDVDVKNKNHNENTADAAANNEGVSNSTNVVTEAVRNAPSISLAPVYPTAACQGGISLGGSGINGSAGIGFSWTKKECATIVLAQNFMAIGMPETSCELLKTTDSWQRAMQANPQLRADCVRPVAVIPPTLAPTPAALIPVPVPVTNDPQGG